MLLVALFFILKEKKFASMREEDIGDILGYPWHGRYVLLLMALFSIYCGLLYNDAFGNDRGFFDFYRSLQAMRKGLTGQSTSYVGPAQGEFFRFFKGESAGLKK